MEKNQKRRGRPPKGDSSMRQIAIRLPVALIVDLDAYAAARRDCPDRSAVIRELLVAGLQKAKR